MSTQFLFYSEYGETLDLACFLRNKGHNVLMYIEHSDEQHIGDGLVEKCKDWYSYIGKGYTWVFDGCAHGTLQDWLRTKGEKVFGGSEQGDELENERQQNQQWFKELGFQQPYSKNFRSIESALAFVEAHRDKQWILKQNADAPKSINYKAHFTHNEDLVSHLHELTTKWNQAQFGEFNVDLMEVVSGLEVAASAFFNGREFLTRNGKIVGFLNFEEKKEFPDGLGEMTGEMGTTFYGCDTDNPLFNEILGKDGIAQKLREIGFHGVFDINCIKTEKGLVGLEPTMRLGIPATSYELIEGLENTAEVLEACASGADVEPIIKDGWGMVLCVVAKPYPVEADLEDEATSQNEKIWPIRNELPVKDFSSAQKEHIHFYNVKKDETTSEYRIVTKNGYLLTVTGSGTSLDLCRKHLIQYLKDNLYIANMKYRTDIGVRLEKYLPMIEVIKESKLFNTALQSKKYIVKPKLFV